MSTVALPEQVARRIKELMLQVDVAKITLDNYVLGVLDALNVDRERIQYIDFNAGVVVLKEDSDETGAARDSAN